MIRFQQMTAIIWKNPPQQMVMRCNETFSTYGRKKMDVPQHFRLKGIIFSAHANVTQPIKHVPFRRNVINNIMGEFINIISKLPVIWDVLYHINEKCDIIST